MKNLIFVAGMAIALSLATRLDAYPAVVINPVADLLFQPMSELQQCYKKGYSYEQIPVSASSTHGCHRGHQLRANDLVDVLEERDDEVKVRTPSFFYLHKMGPSAHYTYWMRKSDIIACNEISCSESGQSYIPKPIVLHKPVPKAVILAQPWYDRKTKTAFSAGTRFSAQEKTDGDHYLIYVFDRSKKQYITVPCPITHCLEAPSADLSEQRKYMIALVRSWITDGNGFIPYVWGGCSIVKRINYPRAHEYTVELANGEPALYYEWPGKNHTPKTGIDCSGLILLAAQSTGIPYFCKNSNTAERTLRPVSAEEPLEIGDVIMIRGHVMLVADFERNTLIEARSYEHGYGKVQEIPLSEQFKDINTYQDLIECYKNKQSVDRLDKDGNVRDSVQIKLFKLA